MTMKQYLEATKMLDGRQMAESMLEKIRKMLDLQKEYPNVSILLSILGQDLHVPSNVFEEVLEIIKKSYEKQLEDCITGFYNL